MPRKKIEVVELNKKEEKIILEESQSALILFWRRHHLLIFLTLLILALTILGVSLIVVAKNLKSSEEPIIKEAKIETNLDAYIADVTSNKALTDDSAKETFKKNELFKSDGEVLLVKTIDKKNFTIKFYSDGTSLKISKDGKSVTRIAPLKDGSYGINEEGIINSKAKSSDVKVTKTADYPWGKVTYLSDGSAIINESKMDIFVRNASDINDNYISNNKVSYLKESKTVGSIKLNYYHDGTIEVIKNGKSYLVRTVDDLNITSNDVTFKNNNQATIISSKKMADGVIIDYYEDGGAIIKNNGNTLSVRKSNSIIIKNNKIYEIVDNIYVEVSKETPNGKYYTNGSAVINYNGTAYYVPENSDIKYQDNNITSIGSNPETKTKETNISGEKVQIFEKTAVITTDDYIAIVPADGVIYDDQGKIKEIDKTDETGDKKEFTIINNTNEKIRYRVVIEKSERTTVDIQYLRYMLSTKSSVSEPTRLDNKIWKDDKTADALNISGTNYILIDSTIEAQDTENISIMLWYDYDTIPNSEQDKYFYGTIKVYAWTEK